jgi:hypothetical protein
LTPTVHDRFDEALTSHPKPHCWDCYLMSKWLREVVISATSAKGILSTTRSIDPLPDSMWVVVQTSYESRIFLIGYSEDIQIHFDFFVVFFWVTLDIVDHLGCVRQECFYIFVFAVEDTKWISRETMEIRLVEKVLFIFKKCCQISKILLTLFLGSKSIDLESVLSLETDALKDFAAEMHHLCIEDRILLSDDLCTDLMKLTISSLLRAIISKMRLDIVEVYRLCFIEHMGEVWAHHSSSRLRLER